jgi:hypothetical protein
MILFMLVLVVFVLLLLFKLLLEVLFVFGWSTAELLEVVVSNNTYAMYGKVGCHVTKRCCGDTLLFLLLAVVETVLPTQVVTSMRLASCCDQEASFELGMDAGGTMIR